MLIRLLPCLWFAAAAAAQAGGLQLPRLLQLGPKPKDALALRITAGGAVTGDDGGALAAAELARRLAAGPANVLLQVDARAPFAAVDELLGNCRDAGVAAVQFAAALPDGTPGAFTLALPPCGEVFPSIDLRLHGDRAGGPPDALRLLLPRLQRGFGQPEAPPFVLGVEVPAETPFAPVLQVLATVAAADVQRVVLQSIPSSTRQQQAQPTQPNSSTSPAPPAQTMQPRQPTQPTQPASPTQPAPWAATDARDPTRLEAPPEGRTPGGQAPGTASIPMDIGPIPQLQVPALSLPRGQPGLRPTPVGCLQRAEAGAAAAGAVSRLGPLPRKPAASAGAIGWMIRQQAADGSFADPGGEGDVELTALVMLCYLSDGSTLVQGGFAAQLRCGTGWLLAQQRHDGRFGEDASRRVGKHAVAAHALVEACGLTGEDGRLLRGAVQDAFDWLQVQQRADGGFGDGDAADTITTSICLYALASAQHFGFVEQTATERALAFLDRVVDPATGGHRLSERRGGDDAELRITATAAAIGARLAAGQDPKQVPLLARGADLLATAANPLDPLQCCLATHALYLSGGERWRQWSQGLTTAVVARQSRRGDAPGSWEPPAGGSRLRTTALNILSMTAYYRYTRLVR